MEHLGHFFELFAGLNAIYIVSNKFLVFISREISTALKGLDNALIPLVQSQENNHIGLLGNGSNGEHKLPSATLKSFLKTSDELKEANIKLAKDIKKAREESSSSPKFNRFCLYSCFYCILMLILIGFNYDFSLPDEREAFLIFNLLSGVLIYYAFKKDDVPPFTYMMLYFLISLSTSIILYFVFKYSATLNCKYDFSYLNRIIAVTASIIHFPIYYIKTNSKSKKKAVSLINRINKAKDENEKFATRLAGAFDVTNNLGLE